MIWKRKLKSSLKQLEAAEITNFVHTILLLPFNDLTVSFIYQYLRICSSQYSKLRKVNLWVPRKGQKMTSCSEIPNCENPTEPSGFVRRNTSSDVLYCVLSNGSHLLLSKQLALVWVHIIEQLFISTL